jgi:hypothetical protein
MQALEAARAIKDIYGPLCLGQASPESIRNFEHKAGVKLSTDAASLLSVFNGTQDMLSETMISFKPVEEWVEACEVAGHQYAHLRKYFIFADSNARSR